MEKQLLNRMKKHLIVPIWGRAIFWGIGIIMLVAFFTLEPVFGLKLFDGFGAITAVILVISFLVLSSGILNRIALKKQLKHYEKLKILKTVLYDFDFAKPMYNDNVLLGSLFLFGKKSTLVVSYWDIDRLYIYKHSINFFKNQRILKLKLKSGVHIELCAFKVSKNTQVEEDAIIRAILSKNSAIQLGYQP